MHVCVCGVGSCTLYYSSNMPALLTSAPPQTSKLRSFQRQLNLWGFKRISKNGPDKDAYYHEHFIRGHPEYMDKMVRIKIKGNATSPPIPPCSPPSRSPPAMAYGGDDQHHDDVGVESKRGPSPSRSKIRMSKRQSYDLQCSIMRLSPNVTTSQQQPPMAMVHRRRSDPTPYVLPDTLAYPPNHDSRSALYYPPTVNADIPASYSFNQLNGYKTGTFQGQEEQKVASNNTFYPSRISTSDMQMQPSNAFSSNAPSSHQLNANIRQPSFTQADRVISGKTMDRHFSGELSTELKSHLDVEEEDEFDRYIDNNIHFIG